MLVVLATAGTAARAEPAHTRIGARLDPGERRISGQVEASFTARGGEPLTRVYVWRYPNRFARPPAVLDDVTMWWIYPRRFSPGSMHIDSVQVRVAKGAWQTIRRSQLIDEPHALAGRGALASFALSSRARPGQRVDVVMTWRTRVPERFGSFGCTDDGCTLLGGFYPMIAGLDDAGWDLAGPPLRSDIDITVELSEPASLVVLDTWAGNAAARATASMRSAAYATVLTAPRHWEIRRAVAGTTLQFLSTRAPPPADDAEENIVPYTLENYPKHVLGGASRAVELLADVGGPPLPPRILLVNAPLRFELASAQPGLVAVSDRFFRIWPARRFRKFHERRLARELFAQIFSRRITAAGSEAERDIDPAADAIASYLTDLYTLREYSRSEFVDSILEPVAFVPAIDQFLYAPQTMFSSAYFGSVIDDEPLRDDVRRFSHQRPRGRLYYEKLRDLLSPRALRGAMAAMIADGASLRVAAEAAYGGSLDWFFRQWAGPYPRINYRLVSYRSRPRDAGGWDGEVIVERRTAPGDAPPVEPVEVLVVDERGREHTLRWDGRGERGILAVRTRAPIARVVVDPHGRLVESKLGGDSSHAQFDNRDPHRVRFVFRNFGVLLNLTDISGSFVLDFSLGRVHDVHNQLGVAVFSTASTLIGGQVRYTRSFGPEVTPDQLLSAFTLSTTVSRLNTGFFSDAGDDAREATRLSLGAGIGSDNELFRFEPLWSHEIGIGASLSLTRLDAAGELPAETLVAVRGTVSTDRTITPWAGHTLAGRLSLSAVGGDVETRSQLVEAGGVDGIRGYAPGTLFSRSLALASAEWRHTFVHDLDWNMGHFNFVRGFGGVLFADGGTLSACDGYRLARSDSWYASIGYGLHMLYDSFGTLPSMVRLDVAARLVDRQRECLADATGSGPAVQVYLTFVPPF